MVLTTYSLFHSSVVSSSATVSNTSSHINLPATLVPSLGILVLLSLAIGVILWRRQLRRRRARRVSRGIEGRFNMNPDMHGSGLLSLKNDVEDPPYTDMMAVPIPLDSSAALSSRST